MNWTNNPKWGWSYLFGCDKANFGPLVKGSLHNIIFIIALFLICRLHEPCEFGLVTFQFECDALAYWTSIILYSPSDKVTEERWETFQQVSKGRRPSWKLRTPLSVVLYHLSKDLLVFLPALLHFDFEHYSWELDDKSFQKPKLIYFH